MVKIYRECEQFMEEEEFVLRSDYAALLSQRDMLVEAVKHYTKFHKKPCNCPSCKALAKADREMLALLGPDESK